MSVGSSLRRRISKAEARAGIRRGAALGRPTLTDLWLYKLEDAVESLVKSESCRRKAEPEGDYDACFIYAHRDELKTVEDVRAASDDVLLEALGLPNVKNWGWFHYMIRDQVWVWLLARNWGLPFLSIGEDPGWSLTTEDERRVQSARCFVELMRERGHDPAERVRQLGRAFKEEKGWSEERFAALLRDKLPFSHWVYISETFAIRPEVQEKGGPILYDDEAARFLGEIRAAAARRRAVPCASLNEAGDISSVGVARLAGANSAEDRAWAEGQIELIMEARQVSREAAIEIARAEAPTVLKLLA